MVQGFTACHGHQLVGRTNIRCSVKGFRDLDLHTTQVLCDLLPFSEMKLFAMEARAAGDNSPLMRIRIDKIAEFIIACLKKQMWMTIV